LRALSRAFLPHNVTARANAGVESVQETREKTRASVRDGLVSGGNA
jgi:hypothetical protein